MHEYRLYTTVPSPRQNQVLNILAGITASQPVAITQQVLIYQQLKPDSASLPASKKGQVRAATPGALQQQRLNYVKVVRDVDAALEHSGESKAGKWRLREEGLPDPAAKTVISQSVAERELEEAEKVKFTPGSGDEAYKHISQYLSAGTRFVHHNIIIHLTRLHTTATPTDANPMDSPPPQGLENRSLLDPSGAWLLEVCVRVDDGGNAALRDKAVKGLEGFRREVEGAVDLRVPDRLALDPRVR